MATHYDELRKVVADLSVEKSKESRLKLRARAMQLILKAEIERPASESALASEYEKGALDALEIYRRVHEEHEKPVNAAKVGPAQATLNGLLLFAQAIRHAAEHALTVHLSARHRK